MQKYKLKRIRIIEEECEIEAEDWNEAILLSAEASLEYKFCGNYRDSAATVSTIECLGER